MTFSVAARCAQTGMFGIAVSSSSPAVAARCAFVRSGVGSAASQNITDPALGDRCLDLMALGASAEQAIEALVRSSRHIEYRQLTAVDNSGTAYCFSGKKTLGRHATMVGDNVACAGNLLASPDIPAAMVDAFLGSSGHLGARLLQTMRAAEDAGGEEGSVHSAGLLIAGKESWPAANLRVDWHQAGDPIGELAKVWDIYYPQMQDYITRAHDPSAAASYGVPGDE